MPNWCYNNIAIKGKKNDVLAFINRGIENSAKAIEAYGDGTIPTPCDNLEDALETLKKYGVTVCTKGGGWDTSTKQELGVVKEITMATFRPIPTTFLEYDTTNHADKFKDEAKQQKATYGQVGWYDFNNNKWFGCKWNSELNELCLGYNNNDEAILTFSAETAWSVPELWLQWIDKEFPNLYVFICATEESGAFYFYKRVGDNDTSEDLTSEIEGRLIAFDDEHGDMEDEDWDARYDLEMELVDNMRGNFHDFVYDY